MTREKFQKLAAETLDALPPRFREKLRNVAIVIEDLPDDPASGDGEDGLLMGLFEGVPETEKSVWDQPSGPDRVILYQKNIEAVCDTEADIRREIRLTLLHEIGHYFGMSEEQLEDV